MDAAAARAKTGRMNDNLTADRATFVTHLECSLTGEHYAADQLHNLSRAGRPLLVRYDLDSVRAALPRETLAARATDLWRWRELLPVRHTANVVSLGEIETPLVPIARSGGANVWVKDEGRLPTGSFKARGLVMAVAMAKELGVTRIAMPTNGNAGAALAAYASRVGIETIVFCPEDTPEVNVREIAAQGARVWRVNGLIDDCGAIVGRGAAEGRWFDFSTLKEPYRIEGKKTMGLELAAQLGWRLPRAIFYPTGGGTGLIGMWKAFDELERLGWIGRERPRMYAVQASGCAPIVRAFEAGEEHAERWEDAHTVAAGIRVPRAVGDFLILRAVRESEGKALAVGDPAILAAVDACARRDGLLLCPEGGATLAAYQQALRDGEVDEDEEVVLFNCATGLKYPLPAAEQRLDRHAPIDFDRL
ncbi:threonine synthase [Sphingomonas sp. BK235]|nr:threonine synthase [Sphingomonas sp. BK235]